MWFSKQIQHKQFGFVYLGLFYSIRLLFASQKINNIMVVVSQFLLSNEKFLFALNYICMYKPPTVKTRPLTQNTQRKITGSQNAIQNRTPPSSNMTETRNKSTKTTIDRRNSKYQQGKNQKVKPKNSQPTDNKSLLNKYSKISSQSTVTSSYAPYKRAPSNQFKRYLDDSENIFWENSFEVKRFKLLKYIKYSLLALFVFLITTYFLIGRIQPWPEGECPAHANCGVFIHCNRGFVRMGNRCIIDPSLRSIAASTCKAVIQQLQLDYGNQDCTDSKNASLPNKKIRQIIQQFSIQDVVVREGIYQFFQSPANQKTLGFNISLFAIHPTKKIHSFSCRCKLFTESKDFYWIIVTLLVCSMAVGYILKWLQFKRKALQAYEYLKAKAFETQAILIEEHKAPIIKITSQWNDQLWQQIDRLRCQQRKIVYFCEHDQLYWKSFQQI